MSQANNQGKEKSLANKVIELIINDCELVHNRQKEPFAIVGKTGVRRSTALTAKASAIGSPADTTPPRNQHFLMRL